MSRLLQIIVLAAAALTIGAHAIHAPAAAKPEPVVASAPAPVADLASVAATKAQPVKLTTVKHMKVVKHRRHVKVAKHHRTPRHVAQHKQRSGAQAAHTVTPALAPMAAPAASIGHNVHRLAQTGVTTMSHHHSPPRQNVHRGRAPSSMSAAARRAMFASKAKPSAVNAAFNDHAQRQGSAARKLTTQQAAALQASGSKTY